METRENQPNMNNGPIFDLTPNMKIIEIHENEIYIQKPMEIFPYEEDDYDKSEYDIQENDVKDVIDFDIENNEHNKHTPYSDIKIDNTPVIQEVINEGNVINIDDESQDTLDNYSNSDYEPETNNYTINQRPKRENSRILFLNGFIS